jgi:Uma2 family endonuclease
MRVSFALASFVYARGLGRVYAAETGFVIRRSPDTVRAPDASFVGADRLPAGGFGPGFAPIAPDLAVEVMSPSDTIPQVWQKVDDYLGAGVRAVWVVDPARGTVAVHQPGVAARLLAGDDVLDGGAVLPGFQFPVASLFVP